MTAVSQYLLIFVCVLLALQFAMVLPCGLEAQCNASTDSAICGFDATSNCIRRYPSRCHMEVAACKLGKNFTDYNSEYCAMDMFQCEEDYEHWTIFFGN